MAGLPDMPVNVPIDDPNADTEWNDILRAHKIIPEKPPSPTAEIEKAVLEAQRLAHENRLEGKDLEELDELEDLEDDDFLEQYRQRRLQEMNTLSQKSKNGWVYPVSKPSYSNDVTDASKEFPVLVHLSGSNGESRVLSELWRTAAEKYPECKFCEIKGDQCIENYPDKNCPTILVYKDGELLRQEVTLRALGGPKMGLKGVEKLLVDCEIVKITDFRLREKENQGGLRIEVPKNDDDDDDWD